MRNLKKTMLDLLFDFLGALLFDIGIYNFAVNAKFAPVGVSGIALILNYLFHFSMGITTIIINIPIVLVSYKILGFDFLKRSIRTMVVFALVLDFVVVHIPVYQGSQFYAAICTGVLAGLGLSLIYARDSSTGGTDFLVMAVRKLLPHWTIGRISMIVDAVVICIGGLVFQNIDAVILGLMSTTATTIVIDKIMYGLGAGKLIFIVTENSHIVADSISELTGRGCTFLNGEGSYSGEKKTIVMCACSNNQVVSIKRAVVHADQQAFFVVTDSNEVFGEGFKPIKEMK